MSYRSVKDRVGKGTERRDVRAARTALLTAFAVLATVVPGVGAAQDSVSTRLEPVRVTVSRDAARSVLDLPFGVSRLAIDSARTGIRRSSLTEMLFAVPGLSVSNRYNPTQDPRLAVRGFGARSAFGIRGVRVVRDGVPLTVADGQTAVDFVDLEAVGAVEVMRGNAGALYGNSSGGVVELRSESFADDALRGRARVVTNADGTRLSGHVGGTQGPFAWQTTVSHTTNDGPRDYARFRGTSALGDARWRAGGATFRSQLTWYDAPLAENPGALTAAEVARAPAIADSQNIRKRAGKTVRQRLLSLSADRPWGNGSASATVFGGVRDLGNPQAFAIIDLTRRTLGASARVQQERSVGGRALRLALGADAQSQRDDRLNYTNCAGLSGAQRPAATCPTAGDKGSVTLDQLEKVGSAGVFARAEVAAAASVLLTAALRGDRTDFWVDDRRAAGVGGGSTERLHMQAVTPMVGVTWRVRPTASLFANVATSFETPTTTELANRPDGSAGLNRQLDPQRGVTYEAGAKGVIGGRLLYDLSLFDVETRDELVPYEIPASGGRRYFRNAGRTRRRGGELGVTAALGALDVGGSLTRLVYTYEEFTVGTTVLDGKRVPGVAPTTAAIFATLRRSLGYATLEVQQSARTPADDANANHADAYVLWNARLGVIRFSALGIEPVVGVDNVFDRTYVANVVSNAARGRFFETGAGRRVYVGLTMGGVLAR